MGEREAHRDPCCQMSRSAACMENGHAVIASCAQLKTPLSDSSPSILQFLQSPFQCQLKNKQFPSIILHPNYIPPTAPFYWHSLPGLFML